MADPWLESEVAEHGSQIESRWFPFSSAAFYLHFFPGIWSFIRWVNGGVLSQIQWRMSESFSFPSQFQLKKTLSLELDLSGVGGIVGNIVECPLFSPGNNGDLEGSYCVKIVDGVIRCCFA